jgi:hypothetical protein
METFQKAQEYAENVVSEMEAGDFTSEVEIEFVDAYIEVQWATVERKGEFVFLFAEHYPPIFHHVDEVKWYKQRGMRERALLDSWENPDW